MLLDSRPFRALAVALLLAGAATLGACTSRTGETIVGPRSFGSDAALRRSWAIGYPWGDEHNGSARMEAGQLAVGNGALTIDAVRVPTGSSRSSHPPHLPIRYVSGAIHARTPVLIDTCFPRWTVEGEFRAPSAKGSWPAFWLTPVKGWPPESDIVEYKGDATNWFNTFRTPTDVTTERVTLADPARWHHYRAVFRRTDDRDAEVTYFLDGAQKATHRAAFTNRPLHVIINLQMEGSSGSPGPDRATFQARRVRISRERGDCR